MRSTRKLSEVLILQFLLYQCTRQFHVIDAKCSWSSWLPWTCSCCGYSRENDVYRVRVECCDKTFECAVTRLVAEITSANDRVEEKDTCSRQCMKEFSSTSVYNASACSTAKNDRHNVSPQKRIQYCKDTCIRTLTTAPGATTSKTSRTSKGPRIPSSPISLSQTSKILPNNRNGTSTTKTGGISPVPSGIQNTTIIASNTKSDNTVKSNDNTTPPGGSANDKSTFCGLWLGVLILSKLI